MSVACVEGEAKRERRVGREGLEEGYCLLLLVVVVVEFVVDDGLFGACLFLLFFVFVLFLLLLLLLSFSFVSSV